MARTPNIDIREDYGRNYIINGNFDFWQRGTSFVSVGGATYKADRWLTNETGSGTATISRSTDVPNAQSDYSLRWECTSAAALTAGDTQQIIQRIEGSNFRYLHDKTMTLSFWVKTNKTGQYSVTFISSNREISYAVPFTIDAANTWEKKIITIDHDTSGALWLTDNGVGVRIVISLGTGSTFSTSNFNSWESGDIRGAAGDNNIQDTLGNTFYLAQVQLTEGAEALPFRRAGRNIGEELRSCQRYYYNLLHQGMFFNYSGGSDNIESVGGHPVQMRVTPGVSVLIGSVISDFGVRIPSFEYSPNAVPTLTTLSGNRNSELNYGISLGGNRYTTIPSSGYSLIGEGEAVYGVDAEL